MGNCLVPWKILGIAWKKYALVYTKPPSFTTETYKLALHFISISLLHTNHFAKFLSFAFWVCFLMPNGSALPTFKSDINCLLIHNLIEPLPYFTDGCIAKQPVPQPVIISPHHLPVHTNSFSRSSKLHTLRINGDVFFIDIIYVQYFHFKHIFSSIFFDQQEYDHLPSELFQLTVPSETRLLIPRTIRRRSLERGFELKKFFKIVALYRKLPSTSTWQFCFTLASAVKCGCSMIPM